MKKKILLFAVPLLLLAALAYAQIVNVASRGDGSGNLLFHDGATSIMTVKDGTDGVQFHQAVALDGSATLNGAVNIGNANGDAITFIGTVARAPLVTISDHASTTTAVTVTAAQNGVTFALGENGSDPLIFNLPAAVTGMQYTFVDFDATAAADLVINPDNSDTIATGSAGASWDSTGDAVGNTLTIRAINAVNWVVVGSFGTWGAGS